MPFAKMFVLSSSDLPFTSGVRKNLKSQMVGKKLKKKVKQSRYTPWRRLGGEEI
jgi:hypothetical protein